MCPCLAECHPRLWHPGREEPYTLSPAARAVLAPWLCPQGSSQLSGFCLCSAVAPLWGPLTMLFLFLFSRKGALTSSSQSILELRAPCHSSQPMPHTLVPLAPFMAATPSSPPGSCGLLVHPFLDANPVPPLSTSGSRMPSFATLAQHTPPCHPTPPPCYQGSHFPLCRSDHSQIAPLRSGHRRSRAGPEVEEGLLGAEERRSGLLCWLPTPAS